MWKTGLGKILNVHPHIFGQRLVLDFTGNGQKVPLSYIENAGELYAFVTAADDLKDVQVLVANASVQIWMKSGWFSGSARILPEQEQDKVLQTFPPGSIFGEYGARLRPESQKRILVLSIQRNAPCTGEKGPGQYSWIWAFTTLFFFFSWAKNRKK